MRTSIPARAWDRRGSAVLRMTTAATLAIVPLALTGCASNFGAQTNQQYQPAVGTNSREGDVYAINTLVVADDQGSGTVVAALINEADEPDSLDSVQATDSDGVAVTVAPVPKVDLPVRQAVQLGTEGVVRLSGDAVEPGAVLTLTFTFAQAEPVEIEAPVVSHDDEVYADVPVGPSSATG